jgi:hypothetical protein
MMPVKIDCGREFLDIWTRRSKKKGMGEKGDRNMRMR